MRRLIVIGHHLIMTAYGWWLANGSIRPLAASQFGSGGGRVSPTLREIGEQ